MYFLNIVANISESAEGLKYITPFGYADSAEIVAKVSLDGKMILCGMALMVAGILAAYWKYTKKDIQ